jgi:hypothetical protein
MSPGGRKRLEEMIYLNQFGNRFKSVKTGQLL